VTTGLRKDKSIWKFLGELADHIDSRKYQVVDYWEADLHAIGVASPNNPDHLVYVCSFEQPPGTFVYECETSNAEIPHATTSRGTASSVHELASVIHRHLSQEPPLARQ
jgi:hypothetical protein